MGHGQPKVFIWIMLIVHKYPMLDTTFQGHRSIGSGINYFSNFLPYGDVVAIFIYDWTV